MGPVLHIDLETRSCADLTKVGAHRYAEDPSTSIVCGSYRFDDGPVLNWRGEMPPTEVRNHIANGGPMTGHNQQFERIVINARFAAYGISVRPEVQNCTMARALAVGLPAALFGLGKALKIEQAKDYDGHKLMMEMCRPKTREPLTWHEKPEAVTRLSQYCDQDVLAECDVDNQLPPLSERERAVWIVDQKINDRGFAVDIPLCQAANAAVVEAQRRADLAMWRVTGGAIQKASQTKKLAEWVAARGVPCESVADTEIDELLVAADVLSDPTVTEALKLRRNSAGAFKFEAMLRAVCSDGRIRGSLQYHGTHGGRWAGRVVQPQNFKRVPEAQEDQVALALDVLRTHGHDPVRALDALEMVLDMPPLEVLSMCARPMIVARPGHKLVDADFSNIEGRICAWFAGAWMKLDAFRAYDAGTGPDLYRVTASDVTGKPLEQITYDDRQDSGKVPELSCQFQGGRRAVQKQAAKIGLTLASGRAQQIVTGWRTSPLNEAIVQMWPELQEAAINAVCAPGLMVPALGGKVRYLKPSDQDFLWCCLPSGRVISYVSPRVGWRKKWFTEDGDLITDAKVAETVASGKAVEEASSFGVTYWGTKSGRWMMLDLYGGMQCAHIVSGTARDLLVEGIFAVEKAGYPIILTVHDEPLAEVPLGFGSDEEFKAIIAASQPTWLDGLPVAINAWEDVRYVK